MKFFRIIIVIVSFFIIPISVINKDWVTVSTWSLLFVSNTLFLVADEIKKHIDEKHEELLKELKNKSDE
jgi:nitrogen fixation protein FixH